MLAVLKAGCAYVPLDPSSPKSRQKTIIEDSQPALIITSESIEISQTEQPWLCLDSVDVSEGLSACETANIAKSRRSLTPENLAYVIYTSGSTGTPKGVLLEHSGLVNLSFSQQKVLPLRDTDQILQFASIAFDAATWEWCMALTSGATLVLVDKATLADPNLLSHYVKQEMVSVATLPPAILPSLEISLWENVKTIIVAGDSCPLNDAKRWSRDRLFINAYGPSETTVCATTGTFSEESQTFSIGEPIPNTSIAILNQHLQAVPVGAVGELFIGGSGLARGYLDRTSLNAERFIQSPFSQTQKLYRTGDLVRATISGELEFIGRLDQQIKIRGFRVELGEIENQLIELDEISEAAVVAQTSESKHDTTLTAYVVPNFFALDESKLSCELSTKQLNDWGDAFESSYQANLNQTNKSSQNQPDQVDAFAIDGWDSSYTRQAIPESQIQDWLGNTTQRIADLQAERVLELGCGSGLIIKGIAPQTIEYVGIDFSQATIDKLRSSLNTIDLKGASVEVLHGDASNLSMVEGRVFDTVIINSVAQYFPNIDYFESLIGSLTQIVEPNGRFFIGDVRCLELLEVFHSSVIRYQQSNKLYPDSFLQTLKNSIDQEKELVISPHWFTELKNKFSRINNVQILPKLDHANNELSAYRYDVVITLKDSHQLSAISAAETDLSVSYTHLTLPTKA